MRRLPTRTDHVGTTPFPGSPAIPFFVDRFRGKEDQGDTQTLGRFGCCAGIVASFQNVASTAVTGCQFVPPPIFSGRPMGEQSPNGSAEPDWLRALRSSALLRAQ